MASTMLWWALPSLPGQAQADGCCCQAGRCVWIRNRAGCTNSTSHLGDCSPQERQDGDTWQPTAESFSWVTACQPSVWPSKLASPFSPCPGLHTLPPLCHTGPPQPMPCCLHHPIPGFELDQQGLSPSCTMRPVATSSLPCPELTQ